MEKIYKGKAVKLSTQIWEYLVESGSLNDKGEVEKKGIEGEEKPKVSNNSHLTAISRSSMSSPTSYLKKEGLISNGDGLDFGSGKAPDARVMGFDKYDPYYQPKFPDKKYSQILCNYVLNVLPKAEEGKVLREIKGLLKPGGSAFISVRRDFDKNYTSEKGTTQRIVKLPYPIVKEESDFAIYQMKKGA